MKTMEEQQEQTGDRFACVCRLAAPSTYFFPYFPHSLKRIALSTQLLPLGVRIVRGN